MQIGGVVAIYHPSFRAEVERCRPRHVISLNRLSGPMSRKKCIIAYRSAEIDTDRGD